MDKDVADHTDAAGKEYEERPFLFFCIFVDDTDQIEDDEQNGINEDENIRSDGGEVMYPWVGFGEGESFVQKGISSLGFYERNFHSEEFQKIIKDSKRLRNRL